MFTCFNLECKDSYNYYVTNYFSKGMNVLEKNESYVFETFGKYINDDGSIDGSKLQEDWFKSMTVDVFLSHSHKDEKFTIALAGWLKHEMGLSAFVDSCLWGYSDDLLSQINNEYNQVRTNEDGTKTYDHKKAKFASSHVHMMLCTALNKMINQAESVFFINTDNSIVKSKYSNETSSPWIYYETCIANTIEKHRPQRILTGSFSEKLRHAYDSDDISIHYPINLKQFIPLDNKTLRKWKESKNALSMHSLDALYELCEISV